MDLSRPYDPVWLVSKEAELKVREPRLVRNKSIPGRHDPATWHQEVGYAIPKKSFNWVATPIALKALVVIYAQDEFRPAQRSHFPKDRLAVATCFNEVHVRCKTPRYIRGLVGGSGVHTNNDLIREAALRD
jgi:hypothetical protein